MAAIEVGRVCVKTRGRESGKKCVVVDLIGKNFVLITGPKELNGVRRRRANIAHVEPLDMKAKIKRGSSDKVIMKAIKSAGITEHMKSLVRPKLGAKS